MKNKTTRLIEASYRTFYGKLFSALFSQFGANYVNEIEDAIQNSFYKSLKSWKPGRIPANKENWLFIVARNDVLNQIKKGNTVQLKARLNTSKELESKNEDLRLKTILYLATFKTISSQVKVVFILKNIFGLHVKEISECTLLTEDAIYKSINRAKSKFKETSKTIHFDLTFEQMTNNEIELVEEIIYAVFNIGFDSFSEKNQTIINEDLCLEALALTKILWDEFERKSTKNLLALICFHLARVPAKVKANKLISFYDQDKTNWNEDFINLGFYYLENTEKINKYYVEALIASKHMTAKRTDRGFWNEIVQLYQILCSLSNSPIMKLNLCYCLRKAERNKEAKELLTHLENVLPNEHIYLSLVKANLLKNKEGGQSEQEIAKVLNKINQKIRRDYILENIVSGF